MVSPSLRWIRPIKVSVFVLAMMPLVVLVWDGYSGSLGPNPVEAVTHRTGDWVLRFLFITLAVTPIRRISGWHGILRLRRMLGLFAFFYACLHFVTYIWLDQNFMLSEVIKDIAKRPYITVGFTCFVALFPLAITSNKTMIKRLGARRWQRLHRLVYPIAIGGVLHYLWLVKSDITEPLLYAVLLVVLFILRMRPLSARLGWVQKA